MKRPFEPSTPDTPIEMVVSGVVIDPASQVPVVVLRGVEEPRLYLPIFVGAPEATAIAAVLAQVSMPRPLTHDLMMKVLELVSCRVTKAHVTRLEEGTFYATVDIGDDEGGEVSLDARPSDALALALRAGAPVFVAEAVLVEAGGLAPEAECGVAPEEEPAGPAEAADAAPPASTSPESGPPLSSEDAGPRSFFGQIKLEELTPEDFGKYKM